MVGVRYIGILGAYFFLSLAYSLISLAFQINFAGGNPVTSETEPTQIAFGNPDAFGHATFPAYWFLNFLGMCALGLACENVAMFVGQPWTGLWLIFWVITNVSTSFYDIDLEPAFYGWGYAWPLHYVVEGSRYLLFDLHSRLGLDYGVLIAWAVINTSIFPIACRFMKYKNVHHVHEYCEFFTSSGFGSCTLTMLQGHDPDDYMSFTMSFSTILHGWEEEHSSVSCIVRPVVCCVSCIVVIIDLSSKRRHSIHVTKMTNETTPCTS